MVDDAVRIAQLQAELLRARNEISSLRAENSALTAERSQAIEQRLATSEILRVIATPRPAVRPSAPTEGSRDLSGRGG